MAYGDAPKSETQDGAAHAPEYRRHQLRTLTLATLAFAASAPGQSFLISVFVDDFIAGTGLSRTWFSGLYAAGTIVAAAAMMLVGRMVDRRGLRVGWIVIAAALAAACGLASVAAGAALAFVSLALLRTFGHGAFTLIGTLLVAGTFERRRGQAVAVANLGLTLASVGLPPLVALLILRTDWRTAYQVLALVLVVVVLPLGLLVRPGPPRREQLLGDGTSTQPTSYPAPESATRGRLPNLPTATTTRLLLVLSVPSLIGTAITFHAVSILAQRDIGYLEAGGVLGLLGASSAVGVILSGSVVDRLTTRAALVLLSSVVLVATVILLVPARWAAYAAFAALGLGMGLAWVINGTVWARTFGTSQLGRVQGMGQSARITAAAVAPLVPAVSLSASGTHDAGILLLSVTAVIALVLSTRPGHQPPSPDCTPSTA
jgi:MFS family permease